MCKILVRERQKSAGQSYWPTLCEDCVWPHSDFTKERQLTFSRRTTLVWLDNFQTMPGQERCCTRHSRGRRCSGKWTPGCRWVGSRHSCCRPVLGNRFRLALHRPRKPTSSGSGPSPCTWKQVSSLSSSLINSIEKPWDNPIIYSDRFESLSQPQETTVGFGRVCQTKTKKHRALRIRLTFACCPAMIPSPGAACRAPWVASRHEIACCPYRLQPTKLANAKLSSRLTRA